MIKTKVLNAVNGGLLNRDSDLSARISSHITQGVISGLEVEAGKIKLGKCLIEVVRTNVLPNEKWLLYVELTADEPIVLGNNKKVYLQVLQDNINDPTLNTTANGENITQIVIADTWGTTNYIKLAETDGNGVITDMREYSKTKYFDGVNTYYVGINNGFFEINT